MRLLPAALLWLCVSSVTVEASRPRPSILRRMNPTYSALSDEHLDSLVSLTHLDTILDFTSPASFLSRLLVPRPAGSAKLIELQSAVEKHFVALDWHVERDHFTASTPYGDKQFTNLIFTHDPLATRRLVLAAHLDSKYFPSPPDDAFVGATDSAAPVAMLLDLATALTGWMNDRRDRVTKAGGEEGRAQQGETLQIVLFDGEEAFKTWTDEDSIYGARHLAEKWKEPQSGPSASSTIPSSTLARISHLVLLDLLGSPQPLIRSFYSSTGWFFDEFAHAEERLGAAGLLWEGIASEKEYEVVRANGAKKERSFFVSRKGASTYGGGIEDDHIPFLNNGVPVVHVIPLPFPHVWHTLADDVTALDLPTIKAWALILRLAVAEYLGLSPPSSATASLPHVKSRAKNPPSQLHLRSSKEELRCALEEKPV